MYTRPVANRRALEARALFVEQNVVLFYLYEIGLVPTKGEGKIWSKNFLKVFRGG